MRKVDWGGGLDIERKQDVGINHPMFPELHWSIFVIGKTNQIGIKCPVHLKRWPIQWYVSMKDNFSIFLLYGLNNRKCSIHFAVFFFPEQEWENWKWDLALFGHRHIHRKTQRKKTKRIIISYQFTSCSVEYYRETSSSTTSFSDSSPTTSLTKESNNHTSVGSKGTVVLEYSIPSLLVEINFVSLECGLSSSDNFSVSY